MEKLRLILPGEIDKLTARSNYKRGDYEDERGILMCGICHTPKEIDGRLFSDKVQRLGVMCDCEQALENMQAAERSNKMRLEIIESQRCEAIPDPECRHWTFENDDKRNPEITTACQKYVEQWQQMRQENVWLLFYGGVGTGKSFYACCIANALIDEGVSVLVTNFPRILHTLQTAGYGEDKNKIVTDMQRYSLVVIDDLGVERSTDYGMEQVYYVIDERYKSGKPLIVTTNLSPAEFKNPGNMRYERIYNRIYENSTRVKVKGESRRVEMGNQKHKKYQEFLGFPE